MLDVRHRVALFLIVLVLFPIGASLPLACCAGMTGGGTAPGAKLECGACCDQAPTNAIARHCCEGGDSFAGPRSVTIAPPALAGSILASAISLPADAAAFAVARAARDPIPRLEPLYTLHASLLI